MEEQRRPKSIGKVQSVQELLNTRSLNDSAVLALGYLKHSTCSFNFMVSAVCELPRSTECPQLSL